MARENVKEHEFTQDDVGWNDVKTVKGHAVGKASIASTDVWRSVYFYGVFGVMFAVLVIGAFNLQIVHGGENVALSKNNRLEEQEVQPDRGIIYDRHGKKLAINVPSFDIALDVRELEEEDVPKVLSLVAGMVEDVEYEDLQARYDEALALEPLTKNVVLVTEAERDEVLDVRSHADDLPGVFIKYSSKREYVGGDMFSHVLGYTGETTPEQIEESEDLGLGDIVGKDGVEAYYDERLRGEKGVRIVEIDAAQNIVADYVNKGSEPVAGDSVYLSIDSKMQKKWVELIQKGMEEYEATGGAAVVEDVNTGEVLAAVSLPNYDNNLFIGGISQDDYSKLISDAAGVPLFNRVTSAQIPPGSMYKTIVASAALQEGAITRDTVFVSTGTLYAENGAYLCQEYHKHVYGSLDLIGGIAKSSNIYFYHTMSTLGIENFVPYAEFFGIGQETGIDVPGEAVGRIHSPESKKLLSETSEWIDPLWYPGDDCNAAIGQGVTVVTPIQVANWAAVIANGGEVLEPRFAYKWASGENHGGDGEETMETVEVVIAREGKVSDSNLALVREGMRNSVYGSQRIIVPLTDAKIPVAAKTGTAEFGVKDEEGYYTKTHAWVMGFFPYDDPKYSFAVFLEGGGASNNSAQLAREFIDWYADSGVGE